MALFQKALALDFKEVQEWEFEATCHPVILAWFGRHFARPEGGWAPTQLLAFLTEFGLLRSLKVREVWLPESRDQACSVIGKFTQGAKADGKRLTRRLVTDRGALDYLVRDTRQSGTLVGAPERCPLGHILTYYDGSQPQYAHLRASMLAYANLLSMLQRFEPDEAVRVATDSIYVRKSALHKAFVAPKKCDCGGGGGRHVRALFTRGRPPSGRPWRVAGQRRADLHATGACGLLRRDLTSQQQRTSFPALRRATMTRCRGIA